MKMKKVILLVAAVSAAMNSFAETTPIVITEVLDGRTFEFCISDEVDAGGGECGYGRVDKLIVPQVSECYGVDSKRWLASQIEGKKFWVDVGYQDNRNLTVVDFPNDLAARSISLGYGISDDPYLMRFAAFASNDNVGMWGECFN